MFTTKLMLAAASIVACTAPATAQMTGSSSTAAGGMHTSSTAGPMTHDAPKMTKMQMASMKRCQGMTEAKMMKSKTCMKMKQMHPDMMKSGM